MQKLTRIFIFLIRLYKGVIGVLLKDQLLNWDKDLKGVYILVMKNQKGHDNYSSII